MRYIYKILLILSVISGFASAGISIHPFINSSSYCSPCHAKNIASINNPALACAEYCMTCHGNMDAHHPVNLKVSDNLPEKYLLTTNSRITCITCHDLKEKRHDTSPWKSESLYENIFRKSTKYKTYFLVDRNNEGQLCKQCH